MTPLQTVALVGLRLTLGWMMLYAGITKVLNPEWSAAGFLNSAKTFPEFYAWFAQPHILPYTNLLNEWGLTIVGAMLILGIGVRLASVLGVAFMLLYYFPPLEFPYPNTHAYVVDEHIIYAFGFLVLWTLRAGRVWGLERWVARLPFIAQSSFLRRLLS